MLGSAKKLLFSLYLRLREINDWTPAALEQAVRDFAQRRSLKLGQVAQPLRVALTGALVSPPIFDVLAALGRDKSLARLEQAIGPPTLEELIRWYDFVMERPTFRPPPFAAKLGAQAGRSSR